MLVTEQVEIELHSNTIKYYRSKDYKIPQWTDNRGRVTVKNGTKILVNTKDLPINSNKLVDVKCDCCGKMINNITFQNYKKYEKNGIYCCNQCANAGHKKYKSFYDWCYENLPKKEADIIMLRWDYELNIRKNGTIISPKEVSFKSNIKYWFKCPDHPEHKPELKNINGFTNKKNNISCNQCNMICVTHQHLIKYLANKEDANKYSSGDHKNIKVRCPECKYEREVIVYNLTRVGFSCPKCSDNKSYSEKFLFNVLEQLLGIDNFLYQLSKKKFKWCDKYRYDFYIPKIHCIIETHGLQHYSDRFIWNNKSLSQIQSNDKQKEYIAKYNNITNYIVLDCRKSELEWIKNSIMQSELPTLLRFKEEDIDWLKCHEYACNSLVRVVCDLWNNNLKIYLISQFLKLHRDTVTKYLKQGVDLGWCNYLQNKGSDLYVSI